MAAITAIAIVLAWNVDENLLSMCEYMCRHNMMVFILTHIYDVVEQTSLGKEPSVKIFSVRSLFDVTRVIRYIDIENEPNIVVYISDAPGSVGVTFPDGHTYAPVTEFRQLLLENASPAAQILFLTPGGHIHLPYILKDRQRRFRLSNDATLTDKLVLHISCDNMTKFLEYMSLHTLNLIILRDRLREFNCVITCSYPITPLMFSWFILTKIKISHSLLSSTVLVSKIS